MIKAILFDMDGLMFDTERLSNNVVTEVATSMGLPVTEEYLMSLKGHNKQDCMKIQRAFWGDDVDLLTYRATYEKRREEILKETGVPVKPGLHKLLNYLKEEGYAIGLATSTAEEKAVSMLKETGVHSYFNEIVYGNQVPKGKPNPDIYLLCAEKLGVEPGNSLVLEDSPTGIESGYRAGCHVLMIPDLIRPSAVEIERTDAVVASLTDVITWLEEKR